MSGINKILQFDENNNNSLTDEAYSTDTQRLNGVGSGIARSSLYNKTLRQVSSVCHGIGKIVAENGYDFTEDIDTLVSSFKDGIMSAKYQKVSEEVVALTGGQCRSSTN